MYFSFRLPERKSYQKERAPAAPAGLRADGLCMCRVETWRAASLLTCVQHDRIVYFFFRADERRRYQEERLPAAPSGLLRVPSRLKAKNSLCSNRLGLFHAVKGSFVSRPADEAGAARGWR